MKQPKQKDYLLRDVPADLWRKAKHYAVDSGKPLRTQIIEALTAYLKRLRK